MSPKAGLWLTTGCTESGGPALAGALKNPHMAEPRRVVVRSALLNLEIRLRKHIDVHVLKEGCSPYHVGGNSILRKFGRFEKNKAVACGFEVDQHSVLGVGEIALGTLADRSACAAHSRFAESPFDLDRRPTPGILSVDFRDTALKAIDGAGFIIDDIDTGTVHTIEVLSPLPGAEVAVVEVLELRSDAFSGVVQTEAGDGDPRGWSIKTVNSRNDGDRESENKKISQLCQKLRFRGRPTHQYKLPYATVWRNSRAA